MANIVTSDTYNINSVNKYLGDWNGRRVFTVIANSAYVSIIIRHNLHYFSQHDMEVSYTCLQIDIVLCSINLFLYIFDDELQENLHKDFPYCSYTLLDFWAEMYVISHCTWK